MKHAARWVALLGLGLAVVLFQRQGFGAVAGLLRVGGVGLLFAAAWHVVPMTINARAWQVLTAPGERAALPTLVLATWLRESVNGLLPVARVGGEVTAYRLLVRRGFGPVPVTASLVVDLVLSVFSQSLFTLLGLVLLLGLGTDSRVAWRLGIGSMVLFAAGLLLVLLQGSSVTARLLHAIDRVQAARWSHLIEGSARLDRGIQAIYARRKALFACVAWQVTGWIAGAGEILIALIVLGKTASIEYALLIEALIQALSSVAFLVPGALGVQEGGFLLVGTALGLDGPTALALAAARRLRDVVVFFPGLVAWSWLEGRGKAGASAPARRGSPADERGRSGVPTSAGRSCLNRSGRPATIRDPGK